MPFACSAHKYNTHTTSPVDTPPPKSQSILVTSPGILFMAKKIPSHRTARDSQLYIIKSPQGDQSSARKTERKWGKKELTFGGRKNKVGSAFLIAVSPAPPNCPIPSRRALAVSNPRDWKSSGHSGPFGAHRGMEGKDPWAPRRNRPPAAPARPAHPPPRKYRPTNTPEWLLEETFVELLKERMKNFSRNYREEIPFFENSFKSEEKYSAQREYSGKH